MSKTSKINLSMEETIKLLNGQSIPAPIPKDQKVTSKLLILNNQYQRVKAINLKLKTMERLLAGMRDGMILY